MAFHIISWRFNRSCCFAYLKIPFYSHIFYPGTEPEIIMIESGNITKANFSIEGMTCSGCEEHVHYEISKLKGIIHAILQKRKRHREV